MCTLPDGGRQHLDLLSSSTPPSLLSSTCSSCSPPLPSLILLPSYLPPLLATPSPFGSIDSGAWWSPLRASSSLSFCGLASFGLLLDHPHLCSSPNRDPRLQYFRPMSGPSALFLCSSPKPAVSPSTVLSLCCPPSQNADTARTRAVETHRLFPSRRSSLSPPSLSPPPLSYLTPLPTVTQRSSLCPVDGAGLSAHCLRAGPAAEPAQLRGHRQPSYQFSYLSPISLPRLRVGSLVVVVPSSHGWRSLSGVCPPWPSAHMCGFVWPGLNCCCCCCWRFTLYIFYRDYQNRGTDLRFACTCMTTSANRVCFPTFY